MKTTDPNSAASATVLLRLKATIWSFTFAAVVMHLLSSNGYGVLHVGCICERPLSVV